MSRDPVVVVPGDLDVEDRIVGPVTFRMAAWLAAAAAGAALVAAGRGAVAPTGLGAVLLLVGVAGAWWRPGGRPVAAWVAPLLAYRKRRRSFAAAPSDGGGAEGEPNTEPEAESVAEPETVAEAEPLDVAAETAGVARRGHRRVVPALLAGVAVGAVAALAAVRGVSPSPAAPVTDVVAPEPSEQPPVVVVVPVDPFNGWEVGGDVTDPFCGC